MKTFKNFILEEGAQIPTDSNAFFVGAWTKFRKSPT